MATSRRLRRLGVGALAAGLIATAAMAIAPTPRPPAAAPGAEAAAAARPQQRAAAADALCGDPRLQGARLPPIVDGGGCGVADPIALESVAGVPLDASVTVGCDVARATADWVETTLRPAAIRHMKAELTGMTAWAGYACRTRNHRPGARLSEHALGRAIDIAGFDFDNGRSVTLLADWRGRADGRAFLRAAWRGACGRYRTVLGPDADRHHRGHLHLDVARRGGGAFCR